MEIKSLRALVSELLKQMNELDDRVQWLEERDEQRKNSTDTTNC